MRHATEERAKEAAALIAVEDVNMRESSSAPLHEDIENVESPSP